MTRPLAAASVGRRLGAMGLDLGIVVGWAGVAAAAGFGARAAGFDFESAAAADTFAFVFLVAPVILTFAWQEASARQATLGKCRLGLVVEGREGGRMGLGRALVRSAVKFGPWQLAHTAVFRMVSGDTSPVPIAFAIGAQAIVVVSVIMLALDPKHRAIHDLIAGTRVLVNPS